jgi:hypothetical protein
LESLNLKDQEALKVGNTHIHIFYLEQNYFNSCGPPQLINPKKKKNGDLLQSAFTRMENCDCGKVHYRKLINFSFHFFPLHPYAKTVNRITDVSGCAQAIKDFIFSSLLLLTSISP